jgi:hypothetical protein
MAIEFYSNDATDTLASSIDNSVTSLTLNDASKFPTSGLFSIKIGSEIMKVTGVSSNTFTVVRGQEGTTAASHTGGDTVRHVLTKRSLDQLSLDQISVGAYSALPTENKAGRLFIPTDGYGVFYNNGSSWLNYGPTTQMYPPDDSQFSWVNQQSSSIASQGSGLLLSVPAQAGLNLTARVKSLASSSNYTATALLFANMQLTNNTSFGLVLRDSTQTKLIQYGTTFDSNGKFIQFVNYLNSPTSYNSTPGSSIGISPGMPIWMRIIDDGTNRRFRFSHDGLSFYEIFANSRTGFITPDQIGFFVDPDLQASTSYLTLVSWHES